MSLTLDHLNPKSISFDKVSRTTIVPSFKSVRSGVFVLSCLHTHPHTHIVTEWSLYPRPRTTSSAWITKSIRNPWRLQCGWYQRHGTWYSAA